MKHIDSFEEFIRNKNKEINQRLDPASMKTRKEEWIQAVNKLYSTIEDWLAPLKQKGLISTVFTDQEVEEPYIGTYAVRKMLIVISQEVVYLEPIGTLMSGAKGKLLLRGNNGEIMIILNRDNSWSLGRRVPVNETWALSQDSFIDALTMLVR